MTTWKNEANRYGRVSQLLHWLIAVCILFMLGLGLLLGTIPGTWKASAIAIHESTGVMILLLVLLRVCWRLIALHPRLPDDIHPLQVFVSKGAHALLYILMIAMPLSGWTMSSALGKPVLLFRVLALPNLIEKDRDLGVTLKNLHGTTSYVLIAMIVLHILGALYHHCIRKDDVLKRMLPECFVRYKE
jgi:cytochrome b561